MDVLDLLPHRYPFLMVDKIVEIVPRESAVAIKNLSHGEPVFLGHFPGLPVFPGVLQLECMAQTAGLCFGQEIGDRVGVLASVSGARFHRPARPGDQLRIEAKIVAQRRGFAKAEGRIVCDDQLVAEANITFALVARSDFEAMGGKGQSQD
jgi:3-hydroxyacyl-[acyl-carrier-protein] dehydratase